MRRDFRHLESKESFQRSCTPQSLPAALTFLGLTCRSEQNSQSDQTTLFDLLPHFLTGKSLLYNRPTANPRQSLILVFKIRPGFSVQPLREPSSTEPSFTAASPTYSNFTSQFVQERQELQTGDASSTLSDICVTHKPSGVLVGLHCFLRFELPNKCLSTHEHVHETQPSDHVHSKLTQFWRTLSLGEHPNHIQA